MPAAPMLAAVAVMEMANSCPMEGFMSFTLARKILQHFAVARWCVVCGGHLGDEDGGDGLVQSGAVHVDRGADGEDEPEHGTWCIEYYLVSSSFHI